VWGAGNLTSSNRKTVKWTGIETLDSNAVAPTGLLVVNTLDSGPGSLRHAILDANAAPNAGGPDVIGAKKLVVIWNNVTQQSWAAGTRRVACNLAAVLPDKSGYAPITGSVKGPVQIGNQPAPPAQQQVPPGAPAPGAGGDDDSDGGEAADSPQTEPSIAPVPLPLPALGGGDKPGTNPLGGGDKDKAPTNPLGGGDKPGANPLGGDKPANPLGGGGNANPLGGEKPPELPKPAEATGNTPG